MKIVVVLIIITLIATNLFWAVQMHRQKDFFLQLIVSSHEKLLNATDPEGEAIGVSPLSNIFSGGGAVSVGESPLSWVYDNYTGHIVIYKGSLNNVGVSMGIATIDAGDRR